MIDLRCGDCLDGMKEQPSESVDLAFLDPPFNVGKKYGGNGNSDRRTDYYAWCEAWIDECFRLLKPTGTLYLMTITRHLGRLYPMLHSRGVFINHVNWRNVSANHDKRSYWYTMQPILVYGKTAYYKFNTYVQTKPLAIASWSHDRRERARGQMRDYWDDIPFVYAGSITHPEAILRPGTNEKLHPAQMPIALAERPLLFSTDEGDTLLEPFAGLAAGALACLKHNRNYIGYEQVSEYVDAANERIHKAQLQLNLF